MERRTFLLAFLVLLVVAGGWSLRYVAVRGTIAEPTRLCEEFGEPAFRVTFGTPTRLDGRVDVPVAITNTYTETLTVYVGSWEVDLYGVRWDGRLTTYGGQRTDVEYVEGYDGEELAPGQSYPLGTAQFPADVERVRLIAFASGACGDATLRV